ncbi:MAG: hypothetical protein JSU85_03785 [Candidatus Zixiibacteriota bacterium]|nr:MAG: hypothetical protein JSU85_03785 [candidate division Zixibacteria bacterium]
MQLVSEYYRDKVLTLDRNKRILKELPNGSGEIKIEQDLFFWKLIFGKRYVECRNEEEAKYLEVFLRAGRNEVFVPADESYLREILPQLLYLKRRHDEIIEDRVDGLIYPRIQERARQRIWHKIFMEINDVEYALVEEY